MYAAQEGLLVPLRRIDTEQNTAIRAVRSLYVAINEKMCGEDGYGRQVTDMAPNGS